MGTEKLSDPRLLPASDKVAIIATKPLVPIKIGRGIKKGNMGVAYIFVALIVMVGVLVYKVI